MQARGKLAIAAAIAVVVVGAGIAVGVAVQKAPSAAAASPAARTTKSDLPLPPYYGKIAPQWCEEDMPCWICSNADGRSDAECLADWKNVLTDETLSWVKH